MYISVKKPKPGAIKHGDLITVTSDGKVIGDYWMRLAMFDEARREELEEIAHGTVKTNRQKGSAEGD